MEKLNVYQLVTDRIIEEMKKGIIPWNRPWTGASLDDGGAINYVTRRPYSLINQLLLGREGEYLTFKQIQACKGRIKKGAKSQIVVFYTSVLRNKVKQVDENGNEIDVETTKYLRMPILKYYNVFHIDDCEGIETKIKADEPIATTQPIESADNIINDYLSRETKLSFQNDKPSNKAYYSLAHDKVVIPMISQYHNAEEYYSTAFHELTHSTIPAYRCDRKAENANAFFGNDDYSREELVAEISSAMICNAIGMDNNKRFRNSVAYIQNWLKVLSNDNKMIIWAAARAEKAAKYIMNKKD